MTPFLQNSTNLKEIYTESGEGLDTKCFKMMMNALSGGPIESIFIDDSDVDSIEALEDCSLQHLNELSLGGSKLVSKLSGLEKLTNLEKLRLGNPIEKAGCTIIAEKLLRNPASKLLELSILSDEIDNDSAELLAESLAENKTLHMIELGVYGTRDEDKRTDDGVVPFLRLVCDIASIEKTYSSNHVLGSKNRLSDWVKYRNASVELHAWNSDNAMKRYIDMAAEIALQNGGNLAVTGRSKVIEFQLNSKNREELCHFQGIDFCYDNIFAQFDPQVLPNVLELIGKHHGQTELYRMLVAGVSVLGGLVNRESVIKQMIAEKSDRMAALAAEISSLQDETRLLNEELGQIRFGGHKIDGENGQRRKGSEAQASVKPLN